MTRSDGKGKCVAVWYFDGKPYSLYMRKVQPNETNVQQLADTVYEFTLWTNDYIDHKGDPALVPYGYPTKRKIVRLSDTPRLVDTSTVLVKGVIGLQMRRRCEYFLGVAIRDFAEHINYAPIYDTATAILRGDNV